MSRRRPHPPDGQRPSDRLEELARNLEVLSAELTTAVQKLREEADHDPDD